MSEETLKPKEEIWKIGRNIILHLAKQGLTQKDIRRVGGVLSHTWLDKK